MSQYQRRHTRAPLFANFLYEDEGHVYKAKIVNISEEGILIDCLPHFPRVNIIPVVIEIPQIHLWETYSLEELREFVYGNLEREIHRARVKTVRRNGETSDVDQIFIRNIGGQILNATDSFRQSILKYVATYTKNTVYLLNLLENTQTGQDRIEKIRLVSELMGYEEDLKVSILKEKVLHSYKSLATA
jgi:hypothetical protein